MHKGSENINTRIDRNNKATKGCSINPKLNHILQVFSKYKIMKRYKIKINI